MNDSQRERQWLDRVQSFLDQIDAELDEWDDETVYDEGVSDGFKTAVEIFKRTFKISE